MKKIVQFGTQVLFVLSVLFFTVWSFTLTDPNLYFSSHPLFVTFQQWMWSVPQPTVVLVYILIILVWMVSYYSLINQSKKRQIKSYAIFGICLAAIIFLIFSNPALSHDLYNYIFNARMVLKYSADPHVQTAIQFSTDTWTRFMHNVHTPAPYWYGWTALTLLPSLFGMQIFILTFLLFKFWSALGMIFLVLAYWLSVNKKSNSLAEPKFLVVLLSPLVLIEYVAIGHNDLWLIGPALLSLVIASRSQAKYWWGTLILLLLSISAKYVSVLLLPMWVYLTWQPLWSKVLPKSLKKVIHFVDTWKWDLCAIVMFLPLLTLRSQFFHPWYLIWSFAFYPLMKSSVLKKVLLLLSISSLFRYIPWMWAGAFEYTPEIAVQQRIITWGLAMIGMLVWVLLRMVKKQR